MTNPYNEQYGNIEMEILKLSNIKIVEKNTE